jgi:hypothetical protein
MILVSLLITYVLARLCSELVANLPVPEPNEIMFPASGRCSPPDPEPEQAERRAEIDGDNVFYF